MIEVLINISPQVNKTGNAITKLIGQSVMSTKRLEIVSDCGSKPEGSRS